VQVALLKVPVPLLEKVTVPVGVIFVPEFVSLTVAVQVVALFSESGFGEQVTTVEVGLINTVKVCWLLVAGPYVVLPAKNACTVWLPIPRLEGLKGKVPVPLVVEALPTVVPSTVKVSVAPLIAAVPLLRWAVSVTGPEEPYARDAGFGGSRLRSAVTVIVLESTLEALGSFPGLPVNVAVIVWDPMAFGV
jgi:hypothetical protein